MGASVKTQRRRCTPRERKIQERKKKYCMGLEIRKSDGPNDPLYVKRPSIDQSDE